MNRLIKLLANLLMHRPFAAQVVGSVLPAILLLITAAMMLGLGAMRSTATEILTTASIEAARDAFWLAEDGIAEGLAFARERTAELPADGSLSLAPRTVPNTGRIEILIRVTGTDSQCPSLDPLPGERTHYEIQATGYADRAAVSTHLQGLYLCRSPCDSVDCIVIETIPVSTYWSARAGPP